MVTFDEFRDSLQRLGGIAELPQAEVELVRAVTGQIEKLRSISARTLTPIIRAEPEAVRVLGLCAGLSQEQLKNLLKQWFNTSAFRRVASESASQLIERLDQDFGLLARIRQERKRDWTYADVVVERFRTRSRAASSIQRGRGVEDQVEAVVEGLGLPYEMRTRFEGRHGESGPCDLAIPAGGADAQIVCAIKGFDSTGSKLTDAASEVARMAEVRSPRQYVFAIVDGIGWLSRQSDLRRIHDLADTQAIDGLFSLAQLSAFTDGIVQATKRLGLGKR